MDIDIIRKIVDHANDYGIRVQDFERLVDAFDSADEVVPNVTLKVGDAHATYDVIYADNVRTSTLLLHHVPGGKLFIVAPRVSTRTAERLRDLGMNFLDANGNAYVRFDSVLIDVRGRTGEIDSSKYALTPTGTNLFSTKRAQVMFALISWPDLVNAVLKDLAAVSGVSIGAAQTTLQLMEQASFIVATGTKRTDRRLQQVDAMIDAWVAAYPTGLGAPARTKLAEGELSRTALETSSDAVDLSGEAAARWIRQPETFTIYTENGTLPREAAMAGRWTTRTNEPNIFVRKRFWTDPAEALGEARISGLRIAPPLLVYADLMASGDSRQREAAAQYRSEHARLRAN
ncbi:type IV toxin-antitoxin system AbiEi family antitoxin [Agromyces italicus]|uniref:type IV toxin-antitoxin system AbiEi family antitoxin n=1 Tax=Agromyces italicus TaxID=279572 RepID=UPI0003B6C866|nr:type IV toxin-antitoxin system AbiEi family antitoxin [Agromyces italicus]